MDVETTESRKRVAHFKSDIVEHWAKNPEMTNVEYRTALADLLSDSMNRSLARERAKACKKSRKKAKQSA